MINWLSKSAEMLPELQEEHGLEFVDNPMSLWLEIWWAFERAYQPPRDEDFIKRVYEFADWCLVQERCDDASWDLLTCVAVCFFEHIPTNALTRADMPRWFKRHEIVVMRDTFSYFLSASEFEGLLALFEPLQSNRKTKRQMNKHETGTV
jgi:hypothetical protein